MLLSGPAVAAEPAFVAHRADGTDVRGAVRELAADRALTVADKEPARVPGDDWVTLRRADRPLPAPPAGGHLALVNGDRVPCSDVRLVGEKLFFKHPDLGDGKETAVPLAALSYWWLAAPASAENAEALRHRLAGEKRGRDRVILRNGDVVEGIVESVDTKGVKIDVQKKLLDLPLDKVAVLAVSTDAPAALRPKGAYVQATLLGEEASQGTRVSLKSTTAGDGHLEGVTLFDAKLRVPLDRVASLDVLGGRATYLSDLKPSGYTFTPYFGGPGESRPLVAGGSADGRDLRLGGSSYARGLGAYAKSSVTYSLAGGDYKAFEALVGLDEAAGPGGKARVRVLADGKALDVGPDRDLTARDGPRKIRVSVAGVKELTLEVDFGTGKNADARVNWADARLVK